MEDKTKILWVSRHQPTDNQLEELNDIFENYELVIKKTTISKAQDIVDLMEKHNCTEVMPVVPHAIRRQLANEHGVKYIFAETMKMNRNGKPQYHHLKFHRVLSEQELAEPTPM